jgi:hypothetical protein
MDIKTRQYESESGFEPDISGTKREGCTRVS